MPIPSLVRGSADSVRNGRCRRLSAWRQRHICDWDIQRQDWTSSAGRARLDDRRRYFLQRPRADLSNRIYQHARRPTGSANFTISTLPTIWDRLAAAGRTGPLLLSCLPFLGLWGRESICDRPARVVVYADCAAGTSDVAFVDRLPQEATGTGADDHPHNDVRAVRAISTGLDAVTKGEWDRTLLIINI